MPTPEVEIEKTLEEASSSLTLVLSREQRKLIVTYLNLLAARNQNVNLVANADFSYVLKHHVLDCLTVAEVMAAQAGYETAHAIDLGSGAGFPGLIVAVALPDIRVLLVESIGKKARFLSECISALGLDDRVEVSSERAEVIAHTSKRAQFDFVTARALGHLGMVVELGLPLLRKNGLLLGQKSKTQIDTELSETQSILAPLGGAAPTIIKPAYQAGSGQHVIVSILKVGISDERYPRAWSAIVKNWKKSRA